MYIYSDYHDSFFEHSGSARSIVGSGRSLISMVGKYVSVEIVKGVHIGAEVSIEGVYAVEIWVEIDSGIMTMILVDSPIQLGPWQWQLIVEEIGREYKRLHTLTIKLDESELSELLQKITVEARILNEDITYVGETIKEEVGKLLDELRPRPWQTILIIELENSMKVYIIPRRIAVKIAA